MKKTFEQKEIEIDKLKFDNENIRFFHINGYTPEESLLMIERDSIQKLINSMNKDGFDGVFPLHIDINNVVGDGNSRLLAFNIAIGNKKYEDLVKRYKIQGFSKLNLEDQKLPVLQYLEKTDLEKYIRSAHLVNLQKDWTTPAKYAYFYKMYTTGINFDFPDNISSIIKNVSLFNFALQNSENENVKRSLEQAYNKKLSMFERMLQNMKLVNKTGELNLNQILEIKINNKGEPTFTQKITLEEFKNIISEAGKYIANNPIGQQRIDLNENDFPVIFNILKSKFGNVKSPKPKTISSPQKNPPKSNQRQLQSNVTNINISEKRGEVAFFLAHNISISYDGLKSIQKTKAKGWRERILIENITWYILAKSLKKIHSFNNWEFIANGDINPIQEKYREAFLKLVDLQETIKPWELTQLKNTILNLFKNNDKSPNGSLLFSNIEQKFLHWLKTDYTLYINNLNEAAHGRWNKYNDNSLSKELDKLFKELVGEFKKEW